MLIAIEGIDGAGKTLISKILFEKIAEIYPGEQIYRTKNSIFCESEYGRDKLENLRDIIWHDEEPAKDPFNTFFWIKIISAWYSVMEPKKAHRDNRLRVYDGWYYRNVIKSSFRCDESTKFLMSLFKDVERPDLTIMIDIDPAVAWERDPYKKSTELGKWDEDLGNEARSFLRYQSRIRDRLLEFARCDTWRIIGHYKEDRPEDVAQRIFDACSDIVLKHTERLEA